MPERIKSKDLPLSNFEPGSQNYRLYNYLRKTNNGIMNHGIRKVCGTMNHTRRISDIRAFLKPHGFTIKSRNMGEGVWYHWIARREQE